MKPLIKLAALLSFMLCAAASAWASVPTEITDLTADATSVWLTVKAIIFSVVAIFVLLRFVKRMSRDSGGGVSTKDEYRALRRSGWKPWEIQRGQRDL